MTGYHNYLDLCLIFSVLAYKGVLTKEEASYACAMLGTMRVPSGFDASYAHISGILNKFKEDE